MAQTSKAIEIIKNSTAPDVTVEGILMKEPTAAALKKNIVNDTQRKIFLDVFKDLVHMNRNFKSMMPLVLAYSKEMAMYQILTEGVDPTDIQDERRGESVIKVDLVVANRCFNNAMASFKLMGLDPASRNRLGIGPPKQQKVKKGEFDDII